MVKVAILNDTTRDAGHIGCQAVMHNLRLLCLKKNWDIVFIDTDCHTFNKSDYSQKIKSADIIILNGEGSLHNNQNTIWLEKMLLAKEEHKKCFLINTTWQSNEINKKFLEIFDTITVRETLSLRQIIKDGAKNVTMLPDLSFCSFGKIPEPDISLKRNSLALIDCTLKNTTNFLINYAFLHNYPLFFMYQKQFNKHTRNLFYRMKHYFKATNFYHLDCAEKLGWYDKIISGRFHANCFTMMLGIPTLALSSNTWKTEGLYFDADLIDFYIHPQDNLIQKMNYFTENNFCEHWIPKAKNYAFNAQHKILKFYSSL